MLRARSPRIGCTVLRRQASPPVRDPGSPGSVTSRSVLPPCPAAQACIEIHRTVCITNASRSMQPCVQDRENLFYSRTLGSTGFFAFLCVPARVLLFGRRSPRRHALAHLLGNDGEEQFRFLQRFFFKIPEDAYFIRVLNSWHRCCSFSVGWLHCFRTGAFRHIRRVSFGPSFTYPPCG
jgi:hypothetical protein